MVKQVLKYPNSILKQKSIEVDLSIWFSREGPQEIQDLAMDLIDTMEALKGVGLSAPQIGILKRVIVVLGVESAYAEPNPIIMINPQVTWEYGKVKDIEGCLSFPGIIQTLERSESLLVEYIDLYGEPKQALAQGIEARCILHEIDHLNGDLFIDKLSLVKKSLLNKKLSKGFITT